MFRVLVFGMTENPGGVESYILNYYRFMNRNRIQFDFLCNSYEPVAYEDELVSLGGRMFHITARSKNASRYRKELEEVFKDHASEWDAVYVNVCSLANIDYLKAAKRYGITKRIIHSHNSRNMDGVLRGLLHKWNRGWLGRYATDFWACSEDAAKWFYRNRLLKRAVIIHNAIDVGRFGFDEAKRNEVRKKHGWEDKFIIGNVGRLHFQKNQTFMLDIFEKYHAGHPDSVLVLVGQGEDERMLKEKCDRLKIRQCVYFAGPQRDIQAWISSFDLFVFPSKFEGLGIAALEAEGNGIPVLASADVPAEVKMNDNFVYLDIDAGAGAWCAKIKEMQGIGREDPAAVKEKFIRHGYDVRTEAVKLERLLAGGGHD